MTRFEQYQLARARKAELWIKSAEYKRLLKADRAASAKADIAAGHTPKCTLTKCASDCPSRGN